MATPDHLERVIDRAAKALDACADSLEKAFPAPDFGQGSVAMIRRWAEHVRQREVIPDLES